MGLQVPKTSNDRSGYELNVRQWSGGNRDNFAERGVPRSRPKFSFL